MQNIEKQAKTILTFVISHIIKSCLRVALDIIFILGFLIDIQAITEYHYVLYSQYWYLEIFLESGHLIFMYPSRNKVSHVCTFIYNV